MPTSTSLLPSDRGPVRAVGIMSGTSLDGIDVVLTEIRRLPPDPQDVTTEAAASAGVDTLRHIDDHFMPFPAAVRDELLTLAGGREGGTRRLTLMDRLLGELYAEAVEALMARQTPDARTPDLIAMHGQTLYHSLSTERYLGYDLSGTLQLGDPSPLAERFGCPVVSNFRVRDVAAGGLGAPLVPFVDYALYSHPDEDRVYLNIGGISNLTFVPAGRGPSPERAAAVVAFDTGPGNMLIDQAVTDLTDGTATFDRDGAMAAKGTPSRTLLDSWMADPYYAKAPPKNSGRENYGDATYRRMKAEATAAGLSDADLVATLTAFTARVNAEAIRHFCPRLPDRLVVSGGGSRNPFLMASLRRELPTLAVDDGDILGYANDAKEALCFAYLGYKRLLGEVNTLPQTTGARHPVIMGIVTL